MEVQNQDLQTRESRLLERLDLVCKQLDSAYKRISDLEKIIEAKDKVIAKLTQKVDEQAQLITKLSQRIDELTHKKSSVNSSIPPSSERLNKPSPKSLRKRSGKSPGGQKGRKGYGMKVVREPDEVIEHCPQQCENCPRAGLCNLHCVDVRYEYEIEVKTKLRAHRLMECGECPLTGCAVRGKFPSHVCGVKQYGAGIACLVVTLSTLGVMSEDRIKKLLNCQGVPISVGTIQSMLHRAAELTRETVERIRQTITRLPVVHYDETGLRVAGKLHWLHCACDNKWRYYSVQAKRGREGIEAANVLPQSNGVAVHDFWKSYETYKNVEHAMCCAHLERELVFAHETGSQSWAKPLQELLQTLCHRRKEVKSEGGDAFPDAELTEYLKRYDCLVDEGIAVNPIPPPRPRKRGRVAKGKFRCLLERFRDYKDDILRFTRNWEIPFTNNTAEQALRGARVKEKVSGCFRTTRGADEYAILRSFVATVQAQGLSVFDALRRAFLGNAMDVLFPVE